jgi:hypothetical protein
MAVNMNSEVFDQFAGLTGDLIADKRLMKILRQLRKGKTGEGALAASCGERVFLPDWDVLINLLLKFEYVVVEATGHGRSKTVALTAKGEEFLQYKIGDKVEPVAETQPTE